MATAAAQTTAGASTTVISPDGLNLRSSASTTAPVIQVIPFGSVLSITGIPTPDSWYPVSWGTLTGWASGTFLASGALDPTAARTASAITAPSVRASSISTPSAAIATSSAFAVTASYYGIDDGNTAGRMMACGAPFDPFNTHAAATNDYGCGTKLHVSTPDGRQLDVVVTDHGLYPQHWIDLTYAAFGTIADHKSGVIQVSVQVVP